MLLKWRHDPDATTNNILKSAITTRGNMVTNNALLESIQANGEMFLISTAIIREGLVEFSFGEIHIRQQ